MARKSRDRSALRAETGGRIYARGASLEGWEFAAVATGDGSRIDVTDASMDGTLQASDKATIIALNALIREGVPEDVADQATQMQKAGKSSAAVETIRGWASRTFTDPGKINALIEIARKLFP